MAKLGVIVEVNLGSNQATGAVAKDKPTGGQPDRRLGPDHQAPPYKEDKADLPSLDDHALATMIFHEVDIVLSTDGHEVMNTTLAQEFKQAEDVLARIAIDKQAVRVTAAQARAMSAEGGTASIPADIPDHQIVEVRYQSMSKKKQELFDKAYRKFYEAAHRYVSRRPQPGPLAPESKP
jgi:hypothetical protein